MTVINKRIFRNSFLLLLVALAAGLGSCNKSKSYSEYLREEEHVVNIYLSGQRVEMNVPADSISFEMGLDAPFYRLDEDGYIYMQVISKGDMDDRVSQATTSTSATRARTSNSNIWMGRP